MDATGPGGVAGEGHGHPVVDPQVPRPAALGAKLRTIVAAFAAGVLVAGLGTAHSFAPQRTITAGEAAVSLIGDGAPASAPMVTSAASVVAAASTTVAAMEVPTFTTTGTTIAVPAQPSEPTAPAAPETTASPSVPNRPAREPVTRAIPTEPATPPPAAPRPPWADSTHVTAAGLLATEVGCANGTSAGALDAFFTQRVGPLLGMDYQHVYPLGDDRYLWLFQDAFVDHSGAATNFSQSGFAHNVALVQEGACFTLLHRGKSTRPASFEPGNGESTLAKWFWPMGGEMAGGVLHVFWVEMRHDGTDPAPGNGLPWHPVRTWLATYDPSTLQRLSFAPAPNSGATPVYGYAVASDTAYTYLFGNTFEQNLDREGGYYNGPHSATAMYLARVPLGSFGSAPEYRTADGWSSSEGDAVAISSRFWVENPMQPRYLGGQWVAVAKVDGYWAEEVVVDVAVDPWGPWTQVQRDILVPRGADPLMNTYHVHLMPWLSGGRLVACTSQNARNMLRDAWPHPERYRLGCFALSLVSPPPAVASTTTTAVEETTTTAELTTTTTTTAPESTTTPESTTISTSTTTTTSTTSTTTTTTTTTPASTTTTTSEVSTSTTAADESTTSSAAP